MRIALFILAFAAVTVGWCWQRSAQTELRAELDALREKAAALVTARQARTRLQQQQPSAEDLANWQRAAEEAARVRREFAAQEETQRGLPALRPGEWISAGAWQNRGDAHPLASVETMLWAAAGGEINAMIELFQLDDVVRARADALLARLPAAARENYTRAEKLVAEFATKAIPLTAAQLVWQQPLGADEAIVGLFLKMPDGDAPTSGVFFRIPEDAPTSARRDVPPPTAPANGKTRTLILSLHRDGAQWKLVVPLSAVARIERELGGAK